MKTRRGFTYYKWNFLELIILFRRDTVEKEETKNETKKEEEKL
jgi:hypothetical protein